MGGGDHRNKNFDRDDHNDDLDDESSMEEKENRAYYERRKRKFAATMDSSLNSNTESTSKGEDAGAKKPEATVLATSQDHRKNENAWSRMSSFVIDGIVSMVLSRAEDDD